MAATGPRVFNNLLEINEFLLSFINDKIKFDYDAMLSILASKDRFALNFSEEFEVKNKRTTLVETAISHIRPRMLCFLLAYGANGNLQCRFNRTKSVLKVEMDALRGLSDDSKFYNDMRWPEETINTDDQMKKQSKIVELLLSVCPIPDDLRYEKFASLPCNIGERLKNEISRSKKTEHPSLIELRSRLDKIKKERSIAEALSDDDGSASCSVPVEEPKELALQYRSRKNVSEKAQGDGAPKRNLSFRPH